MVVMTAIMMVVPGHRMRMVGHVVADDRAADAADHRAGGAVAMRRDSAADQRADAGAGNRAERLVVTLLLAGLLRERQGRNERGGGEAGHEK